MSQTTASSFNPTLTINGDKVVASSLDIARDFGKDHFNVLRDIQELEIPAEFRAFNFEGSSYITQQNKEMPMFNITRKGFVILAMGYNGSKAMQFKIAYIETFDAMERHLLQERPDTEQQLADTIFSLGVRAARAGYDADFVSKIVRYSRAGLVGYEIAKLLECEASTACRYLTVLRDAGLSLPKAKSVSAGPEHCARRHQLTLFPQTEGNA